MTKRKFSSFGRDQALKYLGIEEILSWGIAAAPLELSDFFRERLNRIVRNFDTDGSESGKELLIDAFCEEALERHPTLKAWKEAPLKSDTLTGYVDYLIARKRAYMSTPLLCVVEAKRDDFEQGLAQCAVAMYACAWNNANEGNRITVYGIVSNGDAWQFYKREAEGAFYQTLPYAMMDAPAILGALDHVFAHCEKNINEYVA